MRTYKATPGIVTRRRFVVGAAAAAGTAILAACSVDTGPTTTAAPALTATPTVIASPTRAAGISSAVVGPAIGSVTTGSATATRPVTTGSVTTGAATTGSATATRSVTTGSATTGSAIAGSRPAGVASASSAAGSAAAGTIVGGAAVRVVHTSPDAPAVDVYIDGRKAVTALAFGKASDYQPVTAGPHDFRIFATGADATRDKPVIDGRGTSIGADARLSIIVLDRLANIKGLLADDRTAVAATGKAKVKFIHAAPDAPSVDIAVKGGAVLFGNTEFGKAYPYQEVDAKTYDLEVRMAGKTDVVLSIPGVALNAGTTYSIYAVGLVGGTPKLSAALFVDGPTRQ